MELTSFSLPSSHKPQYPRAVIALHRGKSEVGKKAENRGGNKKPPRAERKPEQNRQKAEHRAKLVHNLVAAHGFCYRFRGKTAERICLRAVCRHFRFPLFYAKLSVKCLFKRFFRKPRAVRPKAVPRDKTYKKPHAGVVKHRRANDSGEKHGFFSQSPKREKQPRQQKKNRGNTVSKSFHKNTLCCLFALCYRFYLSLKQGVSVFVRFCNRAKNLTGHADRNHIFGNRLFDHTARADNAARANRHACQNR